MLIANGGGPDKVPEKLCAFRGFPCVPPCPLWLNPPLGRQGNWSDLFVLLFVSLTRTRLRVGLRANLGETHLPKGAVEFRQALGFNLIPLLHHVRCVTLRL